MNRVDLLQFGDKSSCQLSGVRRWSWSRCRWPLKSALCLGSLSICKPSSPALAVALAARQRRLAERRPVFRCFFLA
jgi:hypothetical protein